MHSPRGCSEELPCFLLTEQRPGKLLQHREEISVPMLPNWGEGAKWQGMESKPLVR